MDGRGATGTNVAGISGVEMRRGGGLVPEEYLRDRTDG